ncbi:MerR family transcriptional regulator [Allokutzneria sp. NRRL B-24872]|uniref:MerR family transcriptional regulator n=1 Tax=Allokutzneria sp. NRRL B-24872 TaxID=1137961 RepID=UPI000A3B3FB8|nr:MerR family transcriptional regulator [Allokutzneria sp. NRRL B-24872]
MDQQTSIARTSITEAAEHFELPLSTLRFWEHEGLLSSHRRANQRCYDVEQLYRIAVVKRWRDTALFGIDQIRELLTAGRDATTWHRVITGAIEAVDGRIRRLEDARDYLRHLRDCSHQGDSDCPGFRATVSLPRTRT